MLQSQSRHEIMQDQSLTGEQLMNWWCNHAIGEHYRLCLCIVCLPKLEQDS